MNGVLAARVHLALPERDPLSDKLYVLAGTDIRAWNVSTAGFMTASFKSKRFRQPAPIGIGAVEVIAKAYPVSISIFYDGALWHTQSVTSDTPIRPPSGRNPQDWQVSVSSAGRVISVRMAVSVADLRYPV